MHPKPDFQLSQSRHSLLSGVSDIVPAAADKLRTVSTTVGEIEVAGQRYLTAEATAALFGITVRTLGRWHAARIGPPKTKVGKLVLYNVERLPEWLASQESQPVRIVGRRR